MLPNAFSRLSIGILHVSFRTYSPLSLEVAEKPNKCKFFGPQFFGKDDPNFSRAGC